MQSPKINNNYSCRIIRVGLEKTPVMIIDDFISDLRGVIEYACLQSKFSPDEKTAYPGVRSQLTQAYVDATLSEIIPMVYEEYAVTDSAHPQVTNAFYSLLSKPETELAVLQCVPHFDSRSSRYFATIHYLNTGDFGGTGFYRHRPSGFERVTEQRFPEYVKMAERFIAKNGLPEKNYINGSTKHFELIECVDYKPNRLVLYPGNLLHSGLVIPNRDINSDPNSGRLTANIFLDFS